MLVLAQTTTPSPAPLPGWELALVAAVVVVLALLAVGVLYAFYRAVGRGSFMESTVRHWIFGLRPKPDTVSAVLDEFVTRRYEFLTFFGQFILSALVVSVIGILLLADRVTAEAGLPILATILGIVLGKTVLARRALPERPFDTGDAALPELAPAPEPAAEDGIEEPQPEITDEGTDDIPEEPPPDEAAPASEDEFAGDMPDNPDAQ
ncbi:MAG TPA: hypothetical protein VH306_10650 [Gaiellaceae bacterium]|jgi:membrane protein implicated in regulation of membrane protease activity